MADKKTKVHNKGKNDCGSLYVKAEPDSMTTDSTVNSDATNFFSDSITSSNGHLKYCYFKYSGECICANLIKFAKSREKRKKWKLTKNLERRSNSSSSDEDNDIHHRTSRIKSKLMNSLRSLDSSDPSFYTAEVEPSKPPSPISFSTFKDPFNSDLSIGKTEQTSDLNHNESNDQSIIQQMEHGLFSNLPNAENSTVEEKIKPFFTRLSIVAQEKLNDNEFKECLTEAYHVCQQDPKEFASKLTTILEESTLPQENFSAQYFHNIFTKFKYVEIQNESLPKSFIDKTASPLSQSTPNKMCPFKVDTPKSLKSKNKSQTSLLVGSTLSRFIDAANQILTHPNVSALKSPSFLSNSISKHNDSSFTYLEKKYIGECPVSQNEIPELTDKEKEVLALCQKQWKALEDSPRKQIETSSPQRKQDHGIDSKIDSPCFTSTKTYEDSPTIEVNNQNSNVDDSILNEYVTQRRRCLETEKKIREIQAVSNLDSGIDSGLLSILTECTDYQKFVKTNNKSSSTKNKKEKVSSTINSKSVTPQNIHRIPKKLDNDAQSSQRKPVVKTVGSKTKVKPVGYTVSKKSILSPHLMPSGRRRRSDSRSLSPLPISRSKSKTQTLAIQKTPPPSVPTFVIIPSTPQSTSSPIPKLIKKDKDTLPESPKLPFISRGIYFTTPERTPVQKKKPKKTFFKVQTPLTEKNFNIDNIRSPVKDYINGKEMVVIKHVHRHENTKITPITKKNLGNKNKFQKDENVQTVKNEVGHTIPTVIEDVNVHYAIELTTVAQKQVFHLQLKDLEE